MALDKNEHIDAVSRMQTYINAHLNERITLKQLSNVAGYSPWHADRLFRIECGLTPFAYIRAIRLSRAALTLRDHPKSVLEVALEYTFDSHEGFTRAFSKHFGISPQKYRQQKPPIRLFIPYDVRHYFHYQNRGGSTVESKSIVPIFTQVIERPKRKAIIKRGIQASEYFAYCEEVGCDVWGILCSIKEALYEPAGMWLSNPHIKKGTSAYVQGVEVSSEYEGKLPEGFDVIDLEPCLYMVFQGPTFLDDDFVEAIQNVKKAIDAFDPALYGYQLAKEIAPRIQLEPRGERGYIEAIPVKPLV